MLIGVYNNFFWLYDTTIGAISCWRKSLLSGQWTVRNTDCCGFFFRTDATENLEYEDIQQNYGLTLRV